ncbi:MAG TPA: methyltransferase domain-containing protein [Polyangiaceae bacterium]|nr:methyltransferase domain-containing protein [Polyangiaceae bacterium]
MLSFAPSPRAKLDRAFYGAQQLSLLVPALAAQRLLRVLSGQPLPEVPRDLVREVKQRYAALLSTDLDNVENGLYPRELLFQFPVAAYARELPRLFADIPRSMRRKTAGDFRDIPRDVDPKRYPAYFRRTFHWQTDGYFSDHSAHLYDVTVEFLFLGTADIMRRQVIPPVTRRLRETGQDGVRLLDVACGTGRLLGQMAVAHPRLRLYGVDLSPAYLRAARDRLAGVPEVSLAAENAENLPYRDGTFDVMTSVFLFHELPRATRRTVLREMKRVLGAGGLLVVEDSAQLAESAVLAPTLARFARDFHEPFYDDYVRDDLAAALEETGFHVESVTPAYVSKVVVARA